MIECKLTNGDFFRNSSTILPHSVNLILTDMPYDLLGPAGQKWDHAIDLVKLEEIFSTILTQDGWVIVTCNFKLMLRLVDVFQHKLEFSHFHIWKKAGSVMPINEYLPLPDSEFIMVFKQKGASRANLPFFPRRALDPKTPYVKRNYSADVPTRRQKKSPVNQSDSSRWVKTIIEAPAKPNMTKSERTSHPTQKSIKLMSQLIVTYSDENATICDPFAGSGTTLIAAYKLGREVFGFEIMEEFYTEATERIRRYLSQGDLFRPEDYSNPEELI